MNSVDNSMASRMPDDETVGLEVQAKTNAAPKGGAGDNRRIMKKAVILVLGLLALGALISLPPVHHLLGNQLRLKQFIQDCGPWAPLVFTLSVAVLVGAGFPRLACHFLGGALFAFWGGLLWSLLGTILGYSVVFFAVRQLGLREVILRKHPTWQKLTGKLQQNSVPAVILFRQIPLPGMVTNAVLGLSTIRRREFFLGTCVGLLPEGVPHGFDWDWLAQRGRQANDAIPVRRGRVVYRRLDRLGCSYPSCGGE